jgi:hypothetical protein
MGDDIKNQLAAISKQLKKLDKIEEKLNDLTSKVTNMESNLAELKSNVESNHAECVENLRIHKKETDNRFLSIAKAHELTVNGIPADVGKTPDEIYDIISSAIGYCIENSPGNSSGTRKHPPQVEIFKAPGSANSLIFRFATVLDKNVYLQRYLDVAKTITHRNLGLSDKRNRVYLQQNLPSALYKVFKFAYEQVKNNVVNKVKISLFGDVMIRVKSSDRFVPVRSMEELLTLLPAPARKNPSKSRK